MSNDRKVKQKPKKLPIIFVASYPSEETDLSYISNLEKEYSVLHPSYEWQSELGKKVLENLPDQELPSSKNQWHQLVIRDFWSIEQSDVLVYDLDANPGFHFVATAIIYGKPILAVSNTLRAVPPYFSGSIHSISHPTDIADYIGYFLNCQTYLKFDNRYSIEKDVDKGTIKKSKKETKSQETKAEEQPLDS